MGTDPKALVERFYNDVWNRRDEAAAREILHPGFRFRGSLGPERTGVDGFIAYLHAVHTALGRFTCIIDELIAADTRAAARMTFKGVHRAPFFGIAPTGREICWTGAAFFTCDHEQITRLWVLGDIDAVKRQLGPSAGTSFETG